MSELTPLLRSLIRDELRQHYVAEIAVVVEVYPHSDEGDDHNYACDLKLREVDLLLRRVPMCSPQLGMVAAPEIGELVLVNFVGGSLQQPVVVGRLHSAAQRPPVHDEGEWRLQTPLAGDTEIAIDAEGMVSLTSGATTIKLSKDGAVEIEGPDDLTIKVDGNVKIECKDAELAASGRIDLGSGGGAVITDRSHKCYYSGAPLVGSTKVFAKG